MNINLKHFIYVLLATFIYISVFMFVQFILSYAFSIFLIKNITSAILAGLIMKAFVLGGE